LRVTSFFQIGQDFSKPQADVPVDVLEEASIWSDCFNVAKDVGPEVSGVIGAHSSTSGAKGLTWVPPSDEINAVSKEVCREGFKVRPNRCGSQLTRFHLRNQVGNGEGFDLHISDDSMLDSSKVKSSFDSTVSCAESKNGG